MTREVLDESAVDPVDRLLDDLRERGITVRVEESALRVVAPKGAITDELGARIRALKPGLLQRLGRGGHSGPRRLPRGEPLPLGIVQRRMWLMDRLEPGSTVNNLPGAWRLTGLLNREAFERAVAAIVERHELLRSRIVFDGTEPGQVVDETYAFSLPVTDLSALPAAERSQAMMKEIYGERDAPFDLERAPLFRCRLFVLDDEDHVFFLLPHHVVWDGWSWDVFLAELHTLYEAFRRGEPSSLPEMSIQFADFAVWHRRLMDGPELERQLAFWRSRLGDGVPRLRLPSDREPPKVRIRAGDRRTVTLEREVLDRLGRLGREENATTFMVFLAAYVAWIHRLSGQADFAVGVPIQDRLHPLAHGLIGPLVNTLVIRARPRPDATFRELLREIRSECVDAYDHQDIPFDRLVESFGTKSREATGDQLFQTLFVYQDVRNRPKHVGDLALGQVHIDTGVAPADLQFGIMTGDDRAVGLFDFSSEIFSAATMSRMAASFGALLDDVSTNADRRLGELRFVGGADQQAGAAGAELFAADRGDGAIRPTPLQEGIWFAERLFPGSANRLVETFLIEGTVHAHALQAALLHLAREYDVMRCTLEEPGGFPVLKIGAEARVSFDTRAIQADDVDDVVAELADCVLDLATGPLFRATLLRTSDDSAVFCVVAHSLLFDERTLGLLLEEWAAAYEAICDGRTPAGGSGSSWMRDYARATHQRLGSEASDTQLAWWMERLADLPPPMDLPLDRGRPVSDGTVGSSVFAEVPSASVQAIEADVRGLGVTREAALLTAVSAVFSRWGRTRRFTMGVVVDVLPDERWRGAVAPLQNTLVFEASVEAGETIGDALRRTDAAWQQLAERAGYPLTRIVEQMKPRRNASHNPFYQVLVTMTAAEPALPLKHAKVTRRQTPQPGLLEDLALSFTPTGRGGLEVRVDYRSDLFDHKTIEDIADHLVHAISELGTPERPAEVLSNLPADHVEELTRRGRGESVDVAPDSCLSEVARRVSQAAGCIAIVGRNASVTYGDMWSASERVANALVAMGVVRGSIVGVKVERSESMVMALLGIWRAGAAYLPLDPSFPRDRLSYMVADAGVDVILTDGRSAETDGDARTLTLDEALGASTGGVLPDGPKGEALAYVIYTSGSTGRPKGVEVTHASLLNFIQSMAREPGLDANDVMLAVTTLSFDIAGLELWLPLWTGAQVVIASAEEVRDGRRLAARMQGSAATVMQATPSTWRMLLDAGWKGRLRKVLCGGEPFPRDLVAPLLERADEVWNLYGPTETTVWSTVARVEAVPEGTVPIGRPIANTRVYVVDQELRLAPPGVPGELWIGGLGVAKGYHDRPDMTRERFLPSPFVEGERVYRTGDLVRWRSDVLEHLGRQDDQVKVHGFRIELGEIEAALGEHAGVRQAVVAVQGQAADARLVGYVVPDPDEPATASDLRRFLRERLPDYMVPGLIVQLQALPLTPNGKVDRKVLPNPLADAPARGGFVPPSSDREKAVARTWAQLLDVEEIGLSDNFFELGGHSLLAIRSVAILLEKDGLQIDPRTLFFQTLEQVAAGAQSTASGGA